MIYTRCARCGKRIEGHAKCGCFKRDHKAYDRTKRDKRAKDYYNSMEWEISRAAAMEADGGIDVYIYMTEGKIVYADTVHHIHPLRQYWDKRADVNNLMSLSSDTHSMIEKNFYRKGDTTIIDKLQEMLLSYRADRMAGVAKKV